jgi:hypothetical protein
VQFDVILIFANRIGGVMVTGLASNQAVFVASPLCMHQKGQ